MKRFVSPLASLMLGLLWVYQHTLSPDHGPLKVLFPNGACCYYPSCSEYAKGSVKKYGAIRSVPRIIWRVLRCHPFATPRVDHP